MIHIDGQQGEGGGQVLRSALVLSAVTGLPFRVEGIRARRPNPGLAPQHLRAVRIFREITGATCKGDELRSQFLQFVPGKVEHGSYTVDIGTAGSVTLALQALAIPLALVGGTSEMVLRGGTHVSWSPPFNYVESCWLPFMTRLGFRLEIRMERAGFYPKGGGEVRVRVKGGSEVQPLRLEEPGELGSVQIVSAAAKLPGHVCQRQASRARVGVQAAGVRPTVHLVELQAPSPGSVVAITGIFENTRIVATALGSRGKRAESVGEEAAAAFCTFIDRPGAVDEHLADQIVLPLALATGESVFTTVRITRHLVTNVEVIRLFLDREIEVEGEVGKPGRVRIQ